MKKILIILLVVFIFIQFFQIDKTNPVSNEGMDFLKIKNTPEPIAKLIRNSCYDCHSNETKYPFYSNIQPAAWLMKSHIDEGRIALNFSTFSTYDSKQQIKKLGEAAEYVKKNKMPLESYLIGHPDAKLTEQERKIIADYFLQTRKTIADYNDL